MDALEAAYRQVRSNDSDVFDHLPYFAKIFHKIAEDHYPKVVELGVRYGVSTVQWIFCCATLGGHLWAVDGAPPVEEPTMQYDLLNPLMDLPYWDFILGWDWEQSVLAQLPREIDILFIDTNHIYEETLNELATYFPRMRSGGRVLLHDTAIERTGNATGPQPSFPVRTAMIEFCEENKLAYENVDNCCGLGTIFVGP